MKNNTNYFSHDWNAHEDSKCQKLKMIHWLSWYWLYREIIERLFNEWWKLLIIDRISIAYQLHINQEEFDKIFYEMIDIWLLKTDDSWFYRSDSLLQRIDQITRIKDKRKQAWRLWWIAKATNCLPIGKQIPSNKSKVNESKVNKNNIREWFEKFRNLYNKKVWNKENCMKKWNKLNDLEKEKIMASLPKFIEKIKDKQFQPFPETYLNQKRWNDDVENVEFDPKTKEERIQKYKDLWVKAFQEKYWYEKWLRVREKLALASISRNG